VNHFEKFKMSSNSYESVRKSIISADTEFTLTLIDLASLLDAQGTEMLRDKAYTLIYQLLEQINDCIIEDEDLDYIDECCTPKSPMEGLKEYDWPQSINKKRKL